MEKRELHEKKSNRAALDTLTAEMTRSLPLPVEKWLYAIGAVGHENIKSVKLKQTGRMKLKPRQKEWTTSEVEQISLTDPPAFHWTVKMKMGKGIVVTGKDSFREGKASMQIKLAGFLPISTLRDNEKTDQSSLQRYLMELAWYPSAALSPLISWKEVDAQTASATITYKGVTGTATYFFDEQHELRKVEAWRYKDSEEEARPQLCIGTIKEQRRVGGLKVPVKMEITWMLEEGAFTWYQFDVHDIEFTT